MPRHMLSTLRCTLQGSSLTGDLHEQASTLFSLVGNQARETLILLTHHRRRLITLDQVSSQAQTCKQTMHGDSGI